MDFYTSVGHEPTSYRPWFLATTPTWRCNWDWSDNFLSDLNLFLPLRHLWVTLQSKVHQISKPSSIRKLWVSWKRLYLHDEVTEIDRIMFSVILIPFCLIFWDIYIFSAVESTSNPRAKFNKEVMSESIATVPAWRCSWDVLGPTARGPCGQAGTKTGWGSRPSARKACGNGNGNASPPPASAKTCCDTVTCSNKINHTENDKFFSVSSHLLVRVEYSIRFLLSLITSHNNFKIARRTSIELFLKIILFFFIKINENIERKTSHNNIINFNLF